MLLNLFTILILFAREMVQYSCTFCFGFSLFVTKFFANLLEQMILFVLQRKKLAICGFIINITYTTILNGTLTKIFSTRIYKSKMYNRLVARISKDCYFFLYLSLLIVQ